MYNCCNILANVYKYLHTGEPTPPYVDTQRFDTTPYLSWNRNTYVNVCDIRLRMYKAKHTNLIWKWNTLVYIQHAHYKFVSIEGLYIVYFKRRDF